MMAGRKRIVVVGGGVAGTTVAHGFDTDAYDLTLVDPYVHRLQNGTSDLSMDHIWH